MKTSVVSLLVILCALPIAAQSVDPLRTLSGTTIEPGTSVPWLSSTGQSWRVFGAFSAHVTYVSESGPDEQRNEVFSTNWFAAGAERRIGERGFVLVRGRASLEPYSIGEEGYPQNLQLIDEGDRVIVDSMRPSDLFGEAAIQVGYRPSGSTMLHVYAAPVGDPALGTTPHMLRSSGRDFAEAPFAWDVQESFHSATSVVTAGFASRWIALDASVFHAAQPSDDYTSIDDGDIDSRSARLTLMPSSNLALQVSRGELGEGLEEREISTASLTWSAPAVAATALWVQRETPEGDAQTAYSFELAVRADRHTLMGRAEWVDRPLGFPEVLEAAVYDQATHVTAGYLYDVVRRNGYRAGLGINIDYRTQTHDLEYRYGHKPQSIYGFVRIAAGR